MWVSAAHFYFFLNKGKVSAVRKEIGNLEHRTCFSRTFFYLSLPVKLFNYFYWFFHSSLVFQKSFNFFYCLWKKDILINVIDYVKLFVLKSMIDDPDEYQKLKNNSWCGNKKLFHTSCLALFVKFIINKFEHSVKKCIKNYNLLFE